MRGVDWQLELANRINELAAVLVIWTEHSAESVHVRDEARLALGTDKLINVLSGLHAPPFPYDRINGLPLDGWTGREPHRGWTRVVDTLEELVVQHGDAQPGEITVAQAMRERAIVARNKAVAQAQQAMQVAQGRVGAAETESREANAAADDAQAQLQRVAQVKISPLLLKAAQQELEATQSAKTEADDARRSARHSFETAATDLALAMEALEALFAPDAPPFRATKAVEPEPAPKPAAAARPSPPPPPPAAEAPAAPPPPQLAPKPSPSPPPASSLADMADETGPAPLGAVRAAVYAGVAGLAIVTVVGIGLLLTHHPAPAVAAAATAPALAAEADPAAKAAAAMSGAWAPPGTCDEPITLAASGDTLSVTSGGKTVSASVATGTAPNSVTARFPDGEYRYALRGPHALVMTLPGGGSLSLVRCAG